MGLVNRRIRDPLHDLIQFSSSDELETVLWKILETPPFQRLRRIKQLGFSDFVFPGATHSRFAHSIGVFHTARQLMKIVKAHSGQGSKEDQALAAALVHDLGHGPFSHAFEEVGERLDLKFANHESMSDMLIRDSEVSELLNTLGSGFANDVADIVKGEGKKTVHYAVVSSQFDADRLDYMRRDRLMTGSQHSAIDFTWLLANLEIGSVSTGVDDTKTGTVDTFVLAPKAIHAAETYILGLFQLYQTVYFHKATRGAEMLFTELLVRLVKLVRDDNLDKTGLPKSHPLARFALDSESVEAVQLLDDTVIFGALSQMAEATDPLIKNFSMRLKDRRLYKYHNIRASVAHKLDPKHRNSDDSIMEIDVKCDSICVKLSEWNKNNSEVRPRILIDQDERSPYKDIGDSKGPIDCINVRTEAGNFVDIKEQSNIVRALKTFKFCRAYFDEQDTDAKDTVEKIVTEELSK